MTEAEACDLFCRWRWPPEGEPQCPRCHKHGHYRWIKPPNRVTFNCKHCNKQYTPTSGTAFGGRKMPYLKLVTAMRILLRSEGRASVLEVSKALNMQYKTAWVLAHKLRELRAGRDGRIWKRYWQRNHT